MLDDEVDELLKRLLLLDPVVCPPRLELGLPALDLEDAKQVLEPAIRRPRVALHVEEEVGLGRFRQQREPELGALGRDQLGRWLARVAPPPLPLCLVYAGRGGRTARAG